MVNINCVCVDEYGRRIGFTDEQIAVTEQNSGLIQQAESSEILDKTEGEKLVKATDFSQFDCVIAVTNSGNKLITYIHSHDLSKRLCQKAIAMLRAYRYPLFKAVFSYGMGHKTTAYIREA